MRAIYGKAVSVSGVEKEDKNFDTWSRLSNCLTRWAPTYSDVQQKAKYMHGRLKKDQIKNL